MFYKFTVWIWSIANNNFINQIFHTEELFTGTKREAIPEENHENYVATTVRVEKLVSSYWLYDGNMGHLSYMCCLFLRHYSQDDPN